MTVGSQLPRQHIHGEHKNPEAQDVVAMLGQFIESTSTWSSDMSISLNYISL